MVVSPRAFTLASAHSALVVTDTVHTAKASKIFPDMMGYVASLITNLDVPGTGVIRHRSPPLSSSSLLLNLPPHPPPPP